MPLTYELVRRFAQAKGKTIALIPTGEARILANGEVDSVHLVENATRFIVEGRYYSRTEFEELIRGSK